ncbi:MAG: hypothetical protein ABJD07_06875 [Gemmatimonadaceae bacterium]
MTDDDDRHHPMNDSFDELMRDAATTYRVPPPPPLDDMWRAIEREHFGAAAPTRRHLPWIAAAGVAAALLCGVAIGRYVVPARSDALGVASTPKPLAPAVAAVDEPSVDGPYELATTRYLGQTAALLTALPVEARSGRAGARFVSQAGELLTTTRLLLDSPAANDPERRALLDDLELVLAQIARLPAKQRTNELDLITETLQQRDVVPRLRSAVADIASSTNSEN